jgi:hypothetical protein
MIRHEHGMLVLDVTLSKEDQEAINSFVHEHTLLERKRIISQIEEHSGGHAHINMPKFKLKRIINNTDKDI